MGKNISQTVVQRSIPSAGLSVVGRSVSLPVSSVTQERLLSSVGRSLSVAQLVAPVAANPNAQGPIPPEAYTFLAAKEKPEADPTFTGTLIEVEYNGKKEVFGVVASHVLGLEGFGRNFVARISHGNKRIDVPAEVVQISARSFLDISLVRLDLSQVPFVRPLPLSEKSVQVGDNLHSDGFGNKMLLPVRGRFIKEIYPAFVRTTMFVPHSERSGLCGAAVLNKNNELVGIHTGSTKSSKTFYEDSGFFAPISAVKALVEAYYNPEKAVIPFTTQGHTIAYFRADEYVVDVKVTDEEGNPLWSQVVEHKFSHSQLHEALKNNPTSRYLYLTTHRTYWDSFESALVESRVYSRGPIKHYKYDLSEGHLVYAVEEN